LFKLSGRKVVAILIILVFMLSFVGCGQKEPAKPQVIKIGVVGSKTGALNAYHTQYIRGLQLGLDHVTGGTKKIAGKDVILIEEDDEGKPDVAKQKAVKLLEQDKVDFLFGTESSTNAIAIAPLAAEYKKIFVVDPAVADALIGASWNKYLFKSGRSSGQDASANAAAIAAPGTKVATFVQDNAFGRDGAAAFKREATKLGATIVAEEYGAPTATDWTPNLQKIIAAKPDYLWILWAGSVTPWQQIADLKLTDKGIKLSNNLGDRSVMPMMSKAIGLRGMCVYQPQLPANPEAKAVNDWFVAEHQKRFNGELPDLFTPAGYNAISAIKTAVEKANGSVDPEALIPVMEGMSFSTPKGKMTFRKEDHLALQTLYVVDLVMGPKGPEPKLVKELTPEETAPPIMNKR